MQGQRGQIRGRAEQAMSSIQQWRGKARELFGTVRANVGGRLTGYRGWPSGAFISGFLAFLAAASAATFFLFPGARMRLWEEIGRYGGFRRPERPIGRFRRWTRRASIALGLSR